MPRKPAQTDRETVRRDRPTDDMGDIVEVFNTRLLDFVDDMDSIYKGAKQIRKALSLAIVLDRKKPVAMFVQHVAAPFGDSIKRKDETFLLTHDYADSVATLSTVAPDVSTVDLVGELKGIWHKLTPENKNAIWEHMRLLTALSERWETTTSAAKKKK